MFRLLDEMANTQPDLKHVFKLIKDSDDPAGYARKISDIIDSQVPTDTLKRILENNIFTPGSSKNFKPKNKGQGDYEPIRGEDGELLPIHSGDNISISSDYTQLDLLDNMHDISSVCKSSDEFAGLIKLSKTLANRGVGRMGFRYELETIAKILEEQPAGFSGFNIATREIWKNGKKVTDIDLTVKTSSGEIAYQMKRSLSALGSADDISDWCSKVRSHVKPAPTIKYVFPKDVMDEIKKKALKETETNSTSEKYRDLLNILDNKKIIDGKFYITPS